MHATFVHQRRQCYQGELFERVVLCQGGLESTGSLSLSRHRPVRREGNHDRIARPESFI
jgi:hypothetical protein